MEYPFSLLSAREEKGQKNADILLCKGNKPFIVVEVETTVVKYLEKIDSIVAYFGKYKKIIMELVLVY